MIISSCSERTRQLDTSSVNRLKDTTPLYSSRNFSYQNRGQSFLSQLLMDTQKIDLDDFARSLLDYRSTCLILRLSLGHHL